MESVLYSFGSTNGDGANPVAGVITDSAGNLYGTTLQGGKNNRLYCYYGAVFDGSCGIVFKVAPNGTETVLYAFCQSANCTDGANPYAGLIMDGNQNLYGTTFEGGAYGKGAVFEVTPSGSETILYSFTGGPDGGLPAGALVFDTSGNLYGTTTSGGDPDCGAGNCGTVFMLAPNGTETVLHEFEGLKSAGDGAVPYAGVAFNKDGNLYGTTAYGGLYGGAGTIFEIAANGRESVLHNLCPACDDGGHPFDGLVMDKNGNSFGTASANGGCAGAVFELRGGSGFTPLSCFCAKHYDCHRGADPLFGSLLIYKGELVGTDSLGGLYNEGNIFKLSKDGQGGLRRVMYNFCALKGCADGANPWAGVIADGNGNLYGTTYAGGAHNAGTVFEINP